MNALKNKWRSRRGASILLALLFLLVCMMVGSSVLMAAASNAGKIKSNKEEQQKYLTLSSALELVCGKLEDMQYTGRYDYVSDSSYDPNHVVRESGDNKEDTYYVVFRSIDGETNSAWGDMEKVLPLGNYLDFVVSEKFKDKQGESGSAQTSFTGNTVSGTITTNYIHRWDGSWTAGPPDTKYEFYVTVDPSADVEGGIGDTVQITVEILTDAARPELIRLDLTAALEDGTDYRMYARMDAVNLLYTPEPGYGAVGDGLKCGTVGWDLKYISKSKTGGTT